MILVDTNVLLDIFNNDPQHAAWSQRQVLNATRIGSIAINDIIYAELSVYFQDVDQLDRTLEHIDIVLVETPRTALFRAGKAFRHYRANKGERISLLPDFFIGAHAEVAGLGLLTRDPRRYRTYFPDLRLISP